MSVNFFARKREESKRCCIHIRAPTTYLYEILLIRKDWRSWYCNELLWRETANRLLHARVLRCHYRASKPRSVVHTGTDKTTRSLFLRSPNNNIDGMTRWRRTKHD